MSPDDCLIWTPIIALTILWLLALHAVIRSYFQD
jgi:hypothetical protein